MTLDLIAQYYDLIFGGYDEDLPMWQKLAEEAGGPLLEIGCGTGRLLLPLAQAGYTITGLDLSEVALDAVFQTIGLVEPEDSKVVRIKNTLVLDNVEISEGLLDAAKEREELEITGELKEMEFDSEGNLTAL